MGLAATPIARGACPGLDGPLGHYDLCVDGAVAAGLWAGAGLASLVPPPVARRQLFGDRSDLGVAVLDLEAAERSDWLSPAGVAEGSGVPITLGAVGAAAVTTAAFGGDEGLALRNAWVGVLATTEAVGLATAATVVLKRSIGRPRPYTSDAFEAAYPDFHARLYAHPDAFQSMPSGHTSMTAALLYTPATLWLLGELDATRAGVHPRWVLVGPAAALGLATGVTATVATLRVRGELHHRDDTMVGALVGATAGVAVPVAHLLPGRAGWRLSARRDGVELSGAW